METELPLALGMVPRVVKHGGRVSLPYPWYVVKAVREMACGGHAQPLWRRGGGDGDGDGDAVDVTGVADALRSMEKRADPASDVGEGGRGPEQDLIRAVARTLWRRRVGVLIHSNA